MAANIGATFNIVTGLGVAYFASLGYAKFANKPDIKKFARRFTIGFFVFSCIGTALLVVSTI